MKLLQSLLLLQGPDDKGASSVEDTSDHPPSRSGNGTGRHKGIPLSTITKGLGLAGRNLSVSVHACACANALVLNRRHAICVGVSTNRGGDAVYQRLTRPSQREIQTAVDSMCLLHNPFWSVSSGPCCQFRLCAHVLSFSHNHSRY